MLTLRKSSPIAFVAVLLPFAIGYAATPEPLTGDAEAQARPIAELLAKRADADSQAAAGLLFAFSHQEQSLRLVAQASLTAPERADLLWLHIQFCHINVSCDAQPLERRLRALDEKNGAGWFVALALASKRGDEDAKSAALAAIARSERVDAYWTTLISRLTPQVASTNRVSLLDAEYHVVGALAAMAIPAYAAITTACKGERSMRDDVVAACRGIAKSLLNGDTIITEMVGAHIARLVWPENSPQWMEAAEARRTWVHRGQFWGAVDAWNRAHASDYLALCAQHRREQDVQKAVLIAIGEDPTPP